MEWYRVSFDDNSIRLDVAPPGGESWTASIEWSSIIRVCYKTGDFIDPDEIYIFVDYRDESYLIPSFATGAGDLWGGIIDRGLFDAQKAIELMSTSGELQCHPEA